ncbi:Glu-tRNA(Gln) amidotransferase subunit GatE [Candidatus Parvarchaeota archaeon]|nr:Glu-tRNA(Gln) amidotransferase subunit GatE [Candidatus Parvarchaeota archaeon]
MEIFKSGIEIHQRLAGTKLFCNCPSRLVEPDAKPSATLRRTLHKVQSELGATDKAAAFEGSLNKTFTYQCFGQSNCLVEADEEPPHGLSREHLKTAVEIALMLKAKIVDEVWVMRKTVIDGSNTSGFQRTAVIGLGGLLETSKGPVGIQSICLEEESAGIVGEGKEAQTYRLDRLGMPLIEIATSPDIKDAGHGAEVAQKLGMCLRMTGKCQRGLGSIRQDVNISIPGGARVEIKGAQSLEDIPVLMQNEIMRQSRLLEIIKTLKDRFPESTIGFEKPADLSELFKSTTCKVVLRALGQGGSVHGLRLPRHNGLLGMELYPGRRYGTELSDYAKAAGVSGIIHSDEDLKKYGFTVQEINAVLHGLKINNNDSFVLVADKQAACIKALELVAKRASMFFVPEETRKALAQGASSFLRPLPGSARMYPETDVLPVRLKHDYLQRVAAHLPTSPEAALANLKSILNEDLANKIFKSQHLSLFQTLVAQQFDPTVTAVTLEETLVSLRREGVEIPDVERTVVPVLAVFEEGKITKAAIPQLIRAVAKKKAAAIEGLAPAMLVRQAIVESGLEKLSGKGLESVVIASNFDIPGIMKKYRLNIDPAELQKIVAEKKR